jgi:hypothetical protein
MGMHKHGRHGCLRATDGNGCLPFLRAHLVIRPPLIRGYMQARGALATMGVDLTGERRA